MTRHTASRDDDRDDTSRPCPSCSQPFTRTGRQAYCTPACRQKAYRSRIITSELAHMPPPPTPQRRRREVTVYQCPHCEEVFLGQQWCPDCQRPCRRLGLGGACPHCTEPVTVDQLLDK